MHWNIDDPKSGPVEKFYLLKVHAEELRKAGYRTDDLQTFSALKSAKLFVNLRSQRHHRHSRFHITRSGFLLELWRRLRRRLLVRASWAVPAML